MMNNLTLQENLQLINEFVNSDNYKELTQLAYNDDLIKSFVKDIELYHETVKFFVVKIGDLDRATLESNYLVDKILLYNQFDSE
tara:strand:- start:939 stop:1190 length:252 start_codon:yes stop_codon:yes gene_type:complete